MTKNRHEIHNPLTAKHNLAYFKHLLPICSSKIIKFYAIGLLMFFMLINLHTGVRKSDKFILDSGARKFAKFDGMQVF